MATGLEALGAASAVVQVIAFAGSLVSLSFKIYDGMPPNENELEEYSAKMMDAARRVQSRGTQVPQGTQVGDKLSKVSKECIDAATELRKETQRLTKCDQDTAIAQRQGQRFQSLEIDLQNLIIKIAEGYNRVEQLVSIEAQATRDAINTHLTSEFKALAIKNISDNQRQRLLKSLKSEEIRERYNAVLPSSDACFERVFAAYERVCRKDPAYKAWKTYKQEIDDGSDDASENPRFDENVDEIDHIWEGFSTWLQSDHKLFWIRGKPGSGKSTLIKFIINDGSTRDMLSSWNPRTRLLSHFFWKIGNEPQNSIKGLLCSLLYDLISDDKDAIDQVLAEFAFSQSKDFYKEWSSQEVEIVLHSLFRAGLHPICIFIDGLDEISNKDGFSVLLDTIQKFTTYQKVKVPEMAVYVYQEFCKLPQDRRDVLPLREFTVTLLAKAQGVFLWLALATKSVTSGIMNGDNKEILSQRLTELPDELESLYQTMWERLNGKSRVYRQTAARYFRFVIADGWKTGLRDKNRLFHFISEPNLAQLSLAIKVEDGLIFSPKANERKLSELNALCDATESDIQTRCAGMLQVGGQSGFTEDEEDLPKAIYPLTRPVQFIHRTAHDFLVDTEAGLKLLTCRLILAKTFYELGVFLQMVPYISKDDPADD
uniref:NACHT domain-containing protein n=1 Tax=Fusarium oxysporum (strain Fo5176) TaxID=660025 RepID=A0A0D2XBQ3_FUSOF